MPNCGARCELAQVTSLVSEDLNGDGTPDRINRDPLDDSVTLAVVYADLNGDTQADLTTYGLHGLTVMLWLGDHYGRPFYIEPRWSRGGLARNDVRFQDWTSDGAPELVYDSVANSGGTGLWTEDTLRAMIHCGTDACNIVWQRGIANDITDYNLGGLLHWRLDMRPAAAPSGNPAIRTLSDGFYIYCCIMSGMASPTSLNILTSTLTLYAWTGETFEVAQEQVVRQATRVDARASLTATNSQGVEAAVSASFNMSAGNANDYCQLTVQGQPVGGHFGCRGNFTTVEWRDLNGDGSPEIVIAAYSAGYPHDSDGKKLAEESCMHQRLIAYQWDGKEAAEIANIAGCVIRDDLYGVRLEDVDNDGLPEILAAPNGALNNRAYKWNGKKYMMWSDIPLK